MQSLAGLDGARENRAAHRTPAAMDPAKTSAVSHYLTLHFPGRYVEHREDFDRDAQSFKVHLDRGTLLLKISDDVLHDTTMAGIPAFLGKHEAIERLESLGGTGKGLLVSRNGLIEFQR